MPLIVCLLILIAALAVCAALLPLALPLLLLLGAVQVVLLYFLLWAALARCRKGHPAWAVLKRFRYAHRGLHDSARGIPENSLAAFRAAVKHGYGAELDVHLTRDGRLAVIHDDSLLRTAGADVQASQLTAQELDAYRLEGTGEKIPFLEEVLPLFEGRAPLIVELKVDDTPDSAIRQIKERNYARSFDGKLGEEPKCTGRILAVGIAYNRKDPNKRHACKVEVLRERSGSGAGGNEAK